METLKRLAAFLLRRELVWLQDHDGEVTLKLAWRNPFGLFCYRHTPQVGMCVLHPDGTVGGLSYVHAWKPYNA